MLAECNAVVGPGDGRVDRGWHSGPSGPWVPKPLALAYSGKHREGLVQAGVPPGPFEIHVPQRMIVVAFVVEFRDHVRCSGSHLMHQGHLCPNSKRHSECVSHRLGAGAPEGQMCVKPRKRGGYFVHAQTLGSASTIAFTTSTWLRAA